MAEIPGDLFEAAAAGDWDALWELDGFVAEHDLLDEALDRAQERMRAGDPGARFLTGWLSLDAGEGETEVAELLAPAAEAGHPMAMALRGDLLARLALGQREANAGSAAGGGTVHDPAALEEARTMLRAGADGGAPMALVLLAHSHIDEHRMTGSEEPLDTAERLLHELDPPPPGSHGAGAATTAAAKSWTRLAGVLKDTGDLDRARRLYQRAIDLGDVGAINDLGTTWHGLDRDKEREWYERAVAAGNPMGHYNLGTQLWEDGKAANDPLLLEEAERLLRVAVADGNLDAHHNLGQLLVHRDDPAAQAEGERLLRTASDRGHLGARFALTDVLKQDPSRVDEAEAILRELVDEHDHVDALNDLALLLWNRGTEESVDEAEALYRRALEHDPDDAIVLTNLAVLLRRRGETDEEACQESRRTSERAAELGHLPARYNLGNWYRDHDRLDEAAQEYRKAVAEGHVAAHCDLAAILDDSDDPADLDEAERLYRWTVGEHEHALSMNHLGVLLLRRDGDRSRDEAFDLIRRSAEAGEGIAVGSWGKVLYQQGEHDKAREWLRRGAREGSTRAKQLLELWDDGQTEYLEQWMPAITGAARRD